ncbi:MAG: sugar phosphate nucleotidyltransferase [Oscillospiraceae bacterium]
MKAIIMAGGEGKRLKQVTGDLPKPMVPFLGKPLMERILELLRENGINDICAALKYNPTAITEYFGDGGRFGVKLEYRFEKEPLGTAGGVKNCADFYGNEDFLVISGDAACDFDLRALVAEHRAHSPAVTIALCESAEPLAYGLVLPDNSGEVRCFIEKPPWRRVVTDLVNTGIYIVSPAAMELVPQGAAFDFARDLFPRLMGEGRVIRGAVMAGYWCDIGSPRAYHRCCLDALDGKLRLFDGEPPQAEAKPAESDCLPLPGERIICRRIPCRDRARLMRAVSERMLELGADFSDGVTLSGGHCGVRVRPEDGESVVVIEAASQDAEFSRELAVAMADVAKALEKDEY